MYLNTIRNLNLYQSRQCSFRNIFISLSNIFSLATNWHKTQQLYVQLMVTKIDIFSNINEKCAEEMADTICTKFCTYQYYVSGNILDMYFFLCEFDQVARSLLFVQILLSFETSLSQLFNFCHCQNKQLHWMLILNIFSKNFFN